MNAVDIRAGDDRYVWHPYTQHGLGDPPTYIRRARGAYLYDAEDRPILDAISSWWVTLHGHAQPEIAEAIAVQARTLEQVIFAGFTHEPAVELAHELVRRAPEGLNRIFYSDDGSTAVEVAVKIALQYWSNRATPRRRVVALENAYHGDTFGAMSVSARSVFNAAFTEQMFEVVRLPDPVDHDVVAAMERAIGEYGDDIAALIVEPLVQGAGGMRMWSAPALAGLRELTARHGILLIADEVMTGFGRTGPLFACEHAQISPDLMCLSKGITGGFMPFGATMAREELFDGFRSDDRTKTLFHGHSYCANPLACAAGIASLKLLDRSSSERRATIEREHRRAAEQLARLGRVENLRVLGTIFALDIRAKDRGYLSGVGPALRRFALERGVLLRPLGDTVYLMPPYCVSERDLAKAYEVIAEFAEAR